MDPCEGNGLASSVQHMSTSVPGDCCLLCKAQWTAPSSQRVWLCRRQFALFALFDLCSSLHFLHLPHGQWTLWWSFHCSACPDTMASTFFSCSINLWPSPLVVISLISKNMPRFLFSNYIDLIIFHLIFSIAINIKYDMIIKMKSSLRQ